MACSFLFHLFTRSLMKSFLILLLLGAFFPCTLSATTIVPFAHLGEATYYSDAVVLARATQEQDSRTPGGMTFREVTFQVKNLVKGPFQAGDEFVLRPESWFTDDFAMDVAGDFAPEIGKTYLLWLRPHQGVWRAQMLSWYVFEERITPSGALLIPFSSSGMEAAARPDGVVPEPLGVYDRDELIQALRHALTGAWTAPLRRNLPAGMLEERTAPAYCDFSLGASTYLCRWQNPALNVYYAQTGAPPGFGTSLDNILNTMKASYTAILPSNQGQVSFTSDCVGGAATSATSNFLTFCNATLSGTSSVLIIFNDPCSEIDDLASCVGVLARGGSFAYTSTHTFKGESWRDAGYGFVIVNNGVTACYPSSTNYQQLITHELTHAYRMDHISTSDPGASGQNMNPNCCNPINTLDVNCMNYTYDIALPLELTQFDVQKKNKQEALVSWTAGATTGSGRFILEHSPEGRHFSELASMPIGNGHFEWLDQHPFAGLNYYRLLQMDADGTVHHLGWRSMRFEQEVSLKVLPNPVGRNDPGMLEMNAPPDAEVQVEIIRSDGVVVSKETWVPSSDMQRMPLPVSLHPGLYRVVASIGKQVVSTVFVKN